MRLRGKAVSAVDGAAREVAEDVVEGVVHLEGEVGEVGSLAVRWGMLFGRSKALHSCFMAFAAFGTATWSLMHALLFESTMLKVLCE